MMDTTMCVWLDRGRFQVTEVGVGQRDGYVWVTVRPQDSKDRLYFYVQTKEDGEELAALLKKLSVPVGEREGAK